MTIAYSIKKKVNEGAVSVALCDITLDASYTSGGYTIATGNSGVGVTVISSLNVLNQGNNGAIYEFVASTGKLKCWVVGLTAGNPLVEATSGQVSTSNVVRVEAKHYFPA